MSTESLKEEAREALRALTVFPPKVNTFSFDAGVAVAGSSDALVELRQRDLAEIIDRKNERYTMHMAIWEYAHEGLKDQSAYKRMAEYFIKHIQEQEAAGKTKTLLLESLEQEHDNLRHALDQLIDLDEVELGLRLAGALWKFWYERSYFAEGRQYIEKLCNLPGSKVPDLALGNNIPEKVRELAWARAKALNDAGNFAYNQGDLLEAKQMYSESLRLREQIGDEQGMAGTWNNLGLLARARGDYPTADRNFRDALKVNQDKGNQSWAAINLNNLGVVAAWQGDGSTAQAFQQKSLELFRSLDDDWGIAMALSDLGAALLLQGDHEGANAHYKESLERRWRIKDHRGVGPTRTRRSVYGAWTRRTGNDPVQGRTRIVHELAGPRRHDRSLVRAGGDGEYAR
jgi:tetratricopeptide (TPR) repeat protein